MKGVHRTKILQQQQSLQSKEIVNNFSIPKTCAASHHTTKILKLEEL